MTIEKIATFLWLMLPIIWSPGPNNLMSASVGGKYNIKKTIPFIVGINSAMLIYCLAVGFGLSVAIGEYPRIFQFIRYGGIIYIFYFAWKFLKADPKIETKDDTPKFRDGFIINILNTKSIIAIALAYSQFLENEGNKAMQVMAITGAFLLLCISGHFLWAAGGHSFAKLFVTPKSLKVQNVIFSAMLFIVGVWLLIT